MKTLKEQLKQHLYCKLYENSKNPIDTLGDSIKGHLRILERHPYNRQTNSRGDPVVNVPMDNRNPSWPYPIGIGDVDGGEPHHHLLHASRQLAMSAKHALNDGHHDVAQQLHTLSTDMFRSLPDHVQNPED